MKKHLSEVCSAIACVLVVICLFQISDLKTQVRSLQSDLNAQMSHMNNSISGISSNIDSKLEEQASLLASSDWAFGEADYDAKTVELICSVSPKEYTASTEAVIVIDGAEYPMTLTNGEYVAIVEIPLFDEVNASKAIFREGDRIRTEALEWYLSPRYDYLLNVYADLSGSATGTPKDGIYTYQPNGVINITADCKQNYGVKSVTLVELLDGKETGRADIPLDNADFFENYQSESGARPVSPDTASEPARPVGTVVYAGPFYYELDKAYEIPYGSTLTLYVEVEDNNGLFYRSVIYNVEVSESGEPTDDNWGLGMEANIYDADGNALFEPAPELYQ